MEESSASGPDADAIKRYELSTAICDTTANTTDPTSATERIRKRRSVRLLHSDRRQGRSSSASVPGWPEG